MTLAEATWDACREPQPMLDHLREWTRGGLDRRKLRLFACACGRDVWNLLTDDRSRHAIEVAERYADGAATLEEFTAAARDATQAALSLRKEPAKGAAFTASSAATGDEALWAGISSVTTRGAETLAKAASKKASDRAAHQAAAEARHADLIRCVFGNPFRPVALGAACRTPALVALAQAAYDARLLPGCELDANALGSLADALERAGANPAAVGHLRGAGPHARGCWVVDAVLGRQLEWPPPAQAAAAAAPAVPPTVGTDEFAPCVFGENADGTFSLGLTDFANSAPVFAEQGVDGGGYGWHGVVDAFVRTTAPALRKKLVYDCEAGMFVVVSKDRKAIETVAAFIRTAVGNPAVLREAVRNADRTLMD